jgi:hypothetical protein
MLTNYFYRGYNYTVHLKGLWITEISPFVWGAAHRWTKGKVSDYLSLFLPGFGLVTPFTGPLEKKI